MTTEKKRLRHQMRRLRAAIPPALRQRDEVAVRERVLAWVERGPVFVYLHVGDELPTDRLIAALRERFTVAVPRIVGSGRMEAVEWREPLVPGRFGIPTSDGPRIDVRTAVVPGLAFDRRGGRLGQGGGYYDRWLARHPAVRTAGVGYGVQLVERVPLEPHDRSLDRVFCGLR